LKNISVIKKLILVFIFAFVFNFIWENFHSLLYVHYKGAPITDIILLKAGLFDAFFITALAFLVIVLNYPKNWMALSVLIAIVFAIFLELYALNSGRWEYKDAMPVIPFLGIGLTPTVQLGLLLFLSFKLVLKRKY